VDSDTSPDALDLDLDVEVGELVDLDHGSPLAAMLGGLDMGAMMGALGIDLPSPDDATLTDLSDQLDDLTTRVDWIARALLAAVAAAPSRFSPTLGAYPGDLDPPLASL